MTWSPSIRRVPESIPKHLERFAEQLGDLTTELRTAVAGLAGDALGKAVRDVLLRFWKTAPRTSHYSSRDEEDPYGWPRDEWEKREHSWEEPVSESIESVPPTLRLATVLQAGGSLLQHGSLLGLFGTGAAVGGVLLFRRSLGVPGIDLVKAIAEIAALIAMLSSASKQLELH
ncbi:MAG: hypothetical protein K8T89_06275 [Planctomycetes bacterium]|nr:hypothetical protein [Planctomycetota bacterium]